MLATSTPRKRLRGFLILITAAISISAVVGRLQLLYATPAPTDFLLHDSRRPGPQPERECPDSAMFF
jgi:hypothetical protein